MLPGGCRRPPCGGHQVPGGRVLTGLGERHPVQGGVELAVPGPAQAVAGLCWPTNGRGRGAVMAGVNVPGPESVKMPTVSPRILAAVSGPQPGIAISAGAWAVTRLVISTVSWSSSAVSWRQRATSARANRGNGPVQGRDASVNLVQHCAAVQRP